jgi:pyruvate dehydrogenase phosphatase
VALADHATVCGIFDGHNGLGTSSVISLSLPTAVLQALDHLFGTTVADSSEEHAELGSSPKPARPSDEAIDKAIKDAFLAVDHTIVNESLQHALSGKLNADTIRILGAAQSGSCALLSFYEHETRQLRVAVTGDSRAVLGRRVTDKSGKESFEVHALSVDQNAHNPAEVARISAEHAGEMVVEKGRVMGWGMSRAFGDAMTKWSLEDQEKLKAEYLGDRSYANIKTPPYFTAEPEITTTKVQKGDFLIMASDGLWECLTSEEAVGLVGLWLQKNKLTRERRRPLTHNSSRPVEPNAKPVERDELPVILKEDDTTRYRYWRTVKRFLNVDDNASVHLARNALGGANRDLTGALLALTPPRARRFR